MFRKLVVATIAAVTFGLTGCASASDNPLAGAVFYVDPDSSAARAASAEQDPAVRAAFERLAVVPSGIWLLPEAHPTPEISGFVNEIVSAAVLQGTVPVFVVYGIPRRDCGNFSAGGLGAAEYGAWVSAIEAGIAGRPVVVILEPDALALSPSCGTEAATASFIRDAIGRLSADQTIIYLDGGHSNWLPADQMAALLSNAGVREVRGFATNVSNYNENESEREYGDRLSGLLGGAHYVIDTSRNGSGSNGEWCNPGGRSLGVLPTGVSGGRAQDANLWIKTPGESDGYCNGGPAAGEWWKQSAIELELDHSWPSKWWEG